MNFLVTGSPGVGKSQFAAGLQARLAETGQEYQVLCVSDLVKAEKLYEKYDKKMDTFIMEDSKVKKRLKEILSSSPGCIIETHTVSVVPKKLVHHTFVLRVPNTKLYYDRLAARSYSPGKIEENVDCEIMQVVWQDAVERFGSEEVSVHLSETPEQMQEALKEALETILELNQQQ